MYLGAVIGHQGTKTPSCVLNRGLKIGADSEGVTVCYIVGAKDAKLFDSLRSLRLCGFSLAMAVHTNH